MIRMMMVFLAGAGSLMAAERPLMRDFIGINGHTVQFRPELYAPVAGRVRDYHPVDWDLGEDTGVLPPFPMAKNGVDWEKVYCSWKERGWRIDASLMFEAIEPGKWQELEADAEAYGRMVARELGPSGERKLLETVEIGNEPGKWSDGEYRTIFKAMATGIRAADPLLKIATCNVTTGASGDYEKSVACLEGMEDLYDVISVHTYAQLENWPTWRRSFPEDPALPNYLKDIGKLCDWRDQHVPGKPVWITEFGYDSSTRTAEAGGPFEKWEGVSDEQQAQWLVRSLLVFSSMPVERAYIYFFNDSDEPSLHASAGLTRNFQPKPSFHAVAHLQRTLGEFRFGRVVRDEPGVVRVHEYEHGSEPDRIIWAVWTPTGDGAARRVGLSETPGRLVSASRMPLSGSSAPEPEVDRAEDGAVELVAGGSPVYLEFARARGD